jgi:hypothetical protein
MCLAVLRSLSTEFDTRLSIEDDFASAEPCDLLSTLGCQQEKANDVTIPPLGQPSPKSLDLACESRRSRERSSALLVPLTTFRSALPSAIAHDQRAESVARTRFRVTPPR